MLRRGLEGPAPFELLLLFWLSETISPGAGTFGSLTWRFIRTVDRRLLELGDWRDRAAELLEIEDPVIGNC